jgi:O-antigen ligase
MLDRFRSFASIDELLGPRDYLLRAGISMFTTQPVFGVGLGAFQLVLQTEYAGLINPDVGPVTTLSHTAIVTIAAELGAVGLIAVATLLASWAWLVLTALRRAGRDHRSVAIGLAASLAVIALSGQSAGRFLEDPYLWVFAVLLVANSRIAGARMPEKQEEHAALLSR